jgi:general secretion pathway protein G
MKAPVACAREVGGEQIRAPSARDSGAGSQILKRKHQPAFTLVELMVVLAVIALLLAVVVPDYVGRAKRAEEAVLQENLALMRDALDKHYADTGRYPDTLEELVAKRYLRAIPEDPFTQTNASWVAVPPADPKKGRVFDVQSSAKGYERW